MKKYLFVLIFLKFSLCYAESSSFQIKSMNDIQSFLSNQEIESLSISLSQVGDVSIDASNHKKLKSITVTNCKNAGRIVIHGDFSTLLSEMCVEKNLNVSDVGVMGFSVNSLKLSHNEGMNSIYVVNSKIQKEINVNDNQKIKKIAIDNSGESLDALIFQNNSAFEEGVLSGKTKIHSASLVKNHDFTMLNLPNCISSLKMDQNERFHGIVINP